MNTPLFARFDRTIPGAGKLDSFDLPIAVQADRRVRIPIVVLPARPQTQGDREYLRALRAAELRSWQASGGDALNLSNTP